MPTRSAAKLENLAALEMPFELKALEVCLDSVRAEPAASAAVLHAHTYSEGYACCLCSCAAYTHAYIHGQGLHRCPAPTMDHSCWHSCVRRVCCTCLPATA